MTDAAVAAFRKHYREEIAPRRYNGWVHFAFTVTFSLVLIAFAVSQVSDVGPLEWLTIPATFLYANLAEYWGHRGPMHHRTPGLGLVFQRHAGQHHRFFTADAMGHEGQRDFYAVLFPPVLVIFFLLAFSLPVGLALAWLTTANVAWLYIATAAAYFLNYELLHWAYHQPEGSLVFRVPGVGALAQHHRAHHRAELMARANFNITYPVGDLIFGTMAK